ncbi:alpha/beta fold hydrolase [Oricola cellulosilytica]|uniref:Alpha/beta fold hydrolase n=1 Tax=Oricola cellulosilytica TaxID=1429082 RepID=A0A4R0PDY0_9HYPH|nr:alpha/beta hydrolase [Oricola cellulosilytica]TCD14963.1 alpha/beta fold hydrolase [Oricola cellulosilytica]
MAVAEIGEAHIHFTEAGSGENTMVFSHGLLMSGEMFANQIAHFKDRYRCITFDHRGQGKSSVTKSGYDIDTLTEDAIRLIERLDAAPCHFVGLSMGGMVGMRIALRRPDLLNSLILIDTSAEPEPPENLPRYRLLNLVARWLGVGFVVGRVMPILFGRTFMNDPSRVDERAYWRKELASRDRTGITRAVKGVINRQGILDQISGITARTLIIVGEEDTATVPERSKRMHAAISTSKLAKIPNAGHSSPIESPEAVNAAMENFLAT